MQIYIGDNVVVKDGVSDSVDGEDYSGRTGSVIEIGERCSESPFTVLMEDGELVVDFSFDELDLDI